MTRFLRLHAPACPNIKTVIYVDDPLMLSALGPCAHVVELKLIEGNPADVRNGLRHSSEIHRMKVHEAEEAPDKVFEELLASPSPTF